MKQFFIKYIDDLFFATIVAISCSPMYYTAFKEWQFLYKKKELKLILKEKKIE